MEFTLLINNHPVPDHIHNWRLQRDGAPVPTDQLESSHVGLAYTKMRNVRLTALKPLLVVLFAWIALPTITGLGLRVVAFCAHAPIFGLLALILVMVRLNPWAMTLILSRMCCTFTYIHLNATQIALESLRPHARVTREQYTRVRLKQRRLGGTKTPKAPLKHRKLRRITWLARRKATQPSVPRTA